MGFYEEMLEQSKVRQEGRIALSGSVTIEELYELMEKRWDTNKNGGFELNKFLFVRSIRLDGYFMYKYDVYITNSINLGRGIENRKNNIVDIRPIKWSYSSLSKAQKEQVKTIRSLPSEEAKQLVLGYYQGLCDAMREVLSDKAITGPCPPIL